MGSMISGLNTIGNSIKALQKCILKFYSIYDAYNNYHTAAIFSSTITMTLLPTGNFPGFIAALSDTIYNLSF